MKHSSSRIGRVLFILGCFTTIVLIGFNLDKRFQGLHLSSFFPCAADMKGKCLFQVPPLENQISTVEKEMRTTQSREVDFIKFEKRKSGDRDSWLVPLNSYLLCIFLKLPPASSAIGDAPIWLCSASSAGHSPPSQTPHSHGCALQRQNAMPCSFP